MISAKQDGFTLIELLLALSFFSFVLLFAIAGFIQINRSYSKGLTVKQVHESGRIILEDISRVIRTSPGSSIISIGADGTDDTSGRRICAGGVRYGWNELRDTGSNREVMIGGASNEILNFSRSTQGACTSPMLSSDESYLDSPRPETVLDPNLAYGGVVVYDLNLVRTGDVVQIEIILASSDPKGDLLDNLDDPTQFSCKGGLINGDEYCDTVRLVTTVSLRT